MHILLKYLGLVAAIVLTIYLVPGITVSGGWVTIFIVALVWSVITLVIRPVLRVLTFPLTLLTFGLFSFILNALLFWAMTLVVPGFVVAGFIPALVGALVLTVISSLINMVL